MFATCRFDIGIALRQVVCLFRGQANYLWCHGGFAKKFFFSKDIIKVTFAGKRPMDLFGVCNVSVKNIKKVRIMCC